MLGQCSVLLTHSLTGLAGWPRGHPSHEACAAVLTIGGDGGGAHGPRARVRIHMCIIICCYSLQCDFSLNSKKTSRSLVPTQRTGRQAGEWIKGCFRASARRTAQCSAAQRSGGAGKRRSMGCALVGCDNAITVHSLLRGPSQLPLLLSGR
ncbi:hypothetical protein BS50DRAFT_135648 [Corynespora cassiicola Philippines]|uniref:Uncharacterized protein n=1 Tax=Corynespora cassiicola Philippines TaxID=1448308 RepID=A0A2T2N9E0_CORCC|nr:hypothetical protein BS50DRAFT_135648 [Corynespora cassiicola Philippines]